jgi:hypothetical protein
MIRTRGLVGYHGGSDTPQSEERVQMATTKLVRRNDTAAIFARVWEGRGRGMTVPVARHILRLGFGDADAARMRELIERNRAGALTAAEQEELDDFVRVGDLLALLQSKARRTLKQDPPRAGHG